MPHYLTSYTRCLCLIVILYLSGVSSYAHAEVSVICKAGHDVTSLSQKQVRDLYFGKKRNLPDGSTAQIADLPAGHPVRVEFYKKVMNKTERQMKIYWAKRVFTGKGMPPQILANEEEVLHWVGGHEKGRVGYIGGRPESDNVKVLFSKD